MEMEEGYLQNWVFLFKHFPGDGGEGIGFFGAIFFLVFFIRW